MLHKRGNKGFTLIELMIVIALLAIAIGIAIPGMNRLIDNSQLDSQANTITSLMKYARTTAITQRTTVRVQNQGDNWSVLDRNNILLRHERFNPNHAEFFTNPTPLDLGFTANGTLDLGGNARVVVCKDDNADFAYHIDIGSSGHVRMHPRGLNASGNQLSDCQP